MVLLALQWHYRVLQAIALDEDMPEKAEDLTVPRYKQIHKVFPFLQTYNIVRILFSLGLAKLLAASWRYRRRLGQGPRQRIRCPFREEFRLGQDQRGFEAGPSCFYRRLIEKGEVGAERGSRRRRHGDAASL